jgi:hypothetical protein
MARQDTSLGQGMKQSALASAMACRVPDNELAVVSSNVISIFRRDIVILAEYAQRRPIVVQHTHARTYIPVHAPKIHDAGMHYIRVWIYRQDSLISL